MPSPDKQRQMHPVYGEMRITSLALPTAWRAYLSRVDYMSLAGGVRRCIADHAALADMVRRDLPAEDIKHALHAMFPFAAGKRAAISADSPPPSDHYPQPINPEEPISGEASE